MTLRDFIPHAGTIELMRSADLLFLPMHDLPPGRRAGLVPQKTYEYLAARRPILAAVPDGDARDLLEASGVAAVPAGRRRGDERRSRPPRRPGVADSPAGRRCARARDATARPASSPRVFDGLRRGSVAA